MITDYFTPIRNVDTKADNLNILSTDENELIRAAVATNEATPFETLLIMSKSDKNQAVRSQALIAVNLRLAAANAILSEIKKET